MGELSITGPNDSSNTAILQKRESIHHKYSNRTVRKDESTYSVAGSPLRVRMGALGGYVWTPPLNTWPDDRSPKGLHSQLILFANTDIGEWFNIGIDYSRNQYHGNGRPSNTSPMPSNGAWYLVEQETSHKLALAPALTVFRFQGDDIATSIDIEERKKNGKVESYDYEILEQGPIITGAIKVGALLGVDFINFNSDDYHGYPAHEAILAYAGASVSAVWDFWISKHAGINVKVESRYAHSFDKDGLAKPTITFLAFGLGLSLR